MPNGSEKNKEIGKATQWKPGQSGNLNGRPKGSLNIKTLIQRIWDEELTEPNGQKVSEGFLATKAIMDQAKKGDVPAYKVLVERMEGMPKQEIEMNANITKMEKIVRDGKEIDFDFGATEIAGPASEVIEDNR